MVDHEINNVDDILRMLDSFLRDEQQFWDEFYEDRNRDIPFFVNAPDENLVSYFQRGVMGRGEVLELGCGAGRNTMYLAQQGCSVTAVDISPQALAWAKERITEERFDIMLLNASIFDLSYKPGSFDIVYDSGCFHHIPPHRRMNYVELVVKALKPKGHFGLICFRPEGGSGLTDWDVYEQRKMGGGLGFTEDRLRRIFSNSFDIQELRQMKEMDITSRHFGKSFCWAILMQPK